MSEIHVFGRAGEDLAASHLAARGWSVLARNWRFHHKEIDLVVERASLVAFVEVKTRGEGGWGHPLESIGWRKRRDLKVAARGWIASHGRPGWSYRFDAVVITRRGIGLRLDHIEDAWRL